MKKLIKTATAFVMAFGILVSGLSVQSSVAAEAETTQTEAGGKDFLKNVLGEYQPLFEGTTFDTKYDKYWHDYTAAVLGESMADPGVQMLKKSIGGSTYGANAGETFFCGFTEDVTKITFGGEDGTDISFTKKDGSTIKHKYAFVKDADAVGATAEGKEMKMSGHLYKTEDKDAGEFTYVFMCPDTPSSTYHLEFRYGDTEENILKLTDGKYKNWLAAGFPTSALSDPNEELLKKVIALFVIENVSSMASEETKIQRLPMTGIWDMDTTLMKNYPGYEKAALYIKLTKAGEGKSYMDIEGTGDFKLTAEYPYYIYDTDKNDGKDAGIYLVESEDEGIKIATYELTEKDGKKALLFNSSEGVITYYYREPITPAKPKLTVAKAAGSKKITVKWNAAADADGYKVLVSTNKMFKKAKTVTVKANTSAKVKSLKKKTYFVKVCAYADGPDGKQSYGKYSNIKSVKVK